MTRNQWLRNAFHPVLIAGMIGCIAVAFADLVRLIDPTQSRAFLVAVCTLTALEACYSYRLLKAREPLARKVLRFRAIELASLLIAIKVGSYIGDSIPEIIADIQMWPSPSSSTLFTRETLVASTMALLSWGAATMTMVDLERLQEPPEHHRDAPHPSRDLTRRSLIGGIILFIITGLSRLRFESLLDSSRPSTPGLVLNVLLYFLLGLVLLGQTQYITLHRRWRAQSIKVTDKLAPRWVRYSLVFIGLVTLVAFVIPTGYTMGFLETVGGVFILLNRIIQFIMSLLAFIVSYPIWLFMNLIKGGAPLPSRPTEPPQMLQPEEAPAVPPGAEMLRSLVFWIVALGIVFYVIRSYLRDHPQVREALTSLWLIRGIRNFLVALWRRLTDVAETVRARIPRRLSLRKRGKTPREQIFRFFRLGALSPRERTLYYYLSILRRAGQQGFRRKDSQTPYEYDAVLEPHLPQAQQEMGLLTDDFVEARYSPHPIDREKEREVRTRWKRVRTAMRTLKKKKKDD